MWNQNPFFLQLTLSVPELEKKLSHSLHWYGCTPVCSKICLLKSDCKLNFFPQPSILQKYFFWSSGKSTSNWCSSLWWRNKSPKTEVKNLSPVLEMSAGEHLLERCHPEQRHLGVGWSLRQVPNRWWVDWQRAKLAKACHEPTTVSTAEMTKMLTKMPTAHRIHEPFHQMTKMVQAALYVEFKNGFENTYKCID